MRYFFLASVLVLLSAALAGCELTSSKPLLDPTEAELAFGERFVAVSFDKDAGSFLNNNGELSALTATAKGTIYEIEARDGGQGGTLRFHPARGLPFDYLLEMTGKDKTAFIAIRKTETGLGALNIDLSSTVLATLEQRGIRPTKKGMEYRVESRGALEETVRAWADNVLAGQDGMEFPFRFEVASTEPASAALMARAMTELCLARAGHPLEPEVKQLRGKFAFGVAIDKIDIPAAKQACGWGADPGAPDSIRYTLARVYVQAKEYDKLPATIEPLIAKDFGLVHLLRADQLMRGLGVTADMEAARRILEGAAVRHPVIAYNLGAMIAHGRFGEPDFAVARRHYEESAEAGISAAKVGLGFLYANGSGVTKNEARAYVLFKEAAKDNDLQGHMEAGRAMYFGIGTNQDFKGAYPYLKTAADAGLPEAQYIVGFMLARGQGTDKSESAAVNMLTKASDAGLLSAKADLGWMVYHGFGATADTRKGRNLMQAAADEGDPTAKKYLDSLTQQVSQTQESKSPSSPVPPASSREIGSDNWIDNALNFFQKEGGADFSRFKNVMISSNPDIYNFADAWGHSFVQLTFDGRHGWCNLFMLSDDGNFIMRYDGFNHFAIGARNLPQDFNASKSIKVYIGGVLYADLIDRERYSGSSSRLDYLGGKITNNLFSLIGQHVRFSAQLASASDIDIVVNGFRVRKTMRQPQSGAIFGAYAACHKTRQRLEAR